IALAQRPRSRLRDAGLSEVVAHVLEDCTGGGDTADRKGQGRHKVHEPREERLAFEKVVMALDQRRRRLEPRERLDLPAALRGEPAPNAGPCGKPVRGVGLEDDEGVGHEPLILDGSPSGYVSFLSLAPGLYTFR